MINIYEVEKINWTEILLKHNMKNMYYRKKSQVATWVDLLQYIISAKTETQKLNEIYRNKNK